MAKDNKQRLEPRIRPHNYEAEQAVLGAMLIDERVPANVFPLLNDFDFHSEAHAEIYRAMKGISKQFNRPIDYITLSDELERMGGMETAGGLSYITTLANIVPSAANHMHYVEIVKRESLKRRLIDAGSKIIEEAYTGKMDNILSFAEKTIYDISTEQDRSDLRPIAEPLAEAVKKFDDIAKSGNSMNGVPTGFWQLDKMLHGLQPSDLIVVGARPGVGKTSFAMNIVQNAARSIRPAKSGEKERSYSCAVFALEMSDAQLAQRMLCSTANVSMTSALEGLRDRSQWQKIFDAQLRLSKTNIFIDDTSMLSVNEILSKCRRVKTKYGLDLIVIDYLQLMDTSMDDDRRGGDQNRNLELGKITRRLKMIAKEINVPIVLLSQLRRPATAAKKGEDIQPQLIDLRDSGSIEQDADIVMFLHRKYASSDTSVRPSVRNKCELIVAKHRNGECGTLPLYWNGEITSYMSYDAPEAVKQMRKDDMSLPERIQESEAESIGEEDGEDAYYESADYIEGQGMQETFKNEEEEKTSSVPKEDDDMPI